MNFLSSIISDRQLQQTQRSLATADQVLRSTLAVAVFNTIAVAGLIILRLWEQ